MRNETKTNENGKGGTMKTTTKTQYGTYTVFPTVWRFTGEHGLTKAIAWAKLCQSKEDQGRKFRVVNEYGTDLGNLGV